MEISAILMGQRVRAARKMKQMSTDELAEKVGVAVESISHIECGARKPSLTLLFNAINKKFGTAAIQRRANLQSNLRVGKKYEAQME